MLSCRSWSSQGHSQSCKRKKEGKQDLPICLSPPLSNTLPKLPSGNPDGSQGARSLGEVLRRETWAKGMQGTIRIINAQSSEQESGDRVPTAACPLTCGLFRQMVLPCLVPAASSGGWSVILRACYPYSLCTQDNFSNHNFGFSSHPSPLHEGNGWRRFPGHLSPLCGRPYGTLVVELAVEREPEWVEGRFICESIPGDLGLG